MVIKLPTKAGQVPDLEQADVRETPASTATATAVGLTDLDYILLTTDADTTRDRVLTAGEGIDFADTGAKGTLTINGENASTTNKGIASFAAADFSVTAGAISLDDDVVSTIDGDSGTATGSSHNIDILGGTGITTAGASNDITVSLTNKTSYLTIPGSAFVPTNPDVDNISYGFNNVTADADGIVFRATVNLPHGAVVTGIIVYGNAAAATGETWKLSLSIINNAGEGGILAGPTSFDTEDTSIDNATINNSTSSYYITTSSLDTNDEIHGVKITYTTDYI